MKKWFLTLTAAGLFTMPALAADAQMLKHTAIVINGEMQAERSVGHIFEENNIAMLPVRQMAAQCGITAESGSAALPLVQAAAEQAGLEMRWNGNTKTAYFMDKDRILYESGSLRAGVLLPEGCAKDSFHIWENQNDVTAMLHFYDPSGEMLVFSLARFDLQYWENEVRENFAVPYAEIYRDNNTVWLCVNASDVQYDPANAEQKAEYEALMAYKEEICAGFYTFA